MSRAAESPAKTLCPKCCCPARNESECYSIWPVTVCPCLVSAPVSVHLVEIKLNPMESKQQGNILAQTMGKVRFKGWLGPGSEYLQAPPPSTAAPGGCPAASGAHPHNPEPKVSHDVLTHPGVCSLPLAQTGSRCSSAPITVTWGLWPWGQHGRSVQPDVLRVERIAPGTMRVKSLGREKGCHAVNNFVN